MIFGFHDLGGAQPVPTRIIGGNIYYEWLIYVVLVTALIIFAYGLIKHIKVATLAKGKAGKRYDHLWTRIKLLLSNVFLQKQLFRGKPVIGFMHSLLFWGFLYLFVLTMWIAVHDKIGFPPFDGNWYIVLSLMADFGGLFATIGIAALGINRYIIRPRRLNDTRPADGLVILMIFVILVTGFLLEGERIAIQMLNELKISGNITALGYEKIASPIGYPIGWLLAQIFSLSGMEVFHRCLWWFHMFLAFAFIAIIPFTKLWHIVAAFIQYPTKNLEPSSLRMVDNIEEAEAFGAENIEDMAWKDFLDMEACIRCGRCQEVCPAFNTGKKLNPKLTVIQSLRHHLDDKAPYLLAKKGAEIEATRFKGDEVDGSAAVEALLKKRNPDINPMEASLVYDVMPPEVTWACTNCRACMSICPMFIEHIDKITEIRRNLVMWQGDMPLEAQNAFTNMERNYNPWGVGSSKRADWLEERKVRDLVRLLPEDGEGDFDYLFFGGCATAYDDRYKKVAETFLRLMDQAGVKIAYLGAEEVCSGDSARRLGNEYLFQTLAQTNIENFKSYGVTKIVTTCPHCFNTLKNEYPQLDGHFEVIHYTVLLEQLLAEGRLKVDDPQALKITYHDSCFLARHNHITEAPRRVLTAAGAQIIEIDKSRENTFCCGAGGGRMWLEEETVAGYKRINATRTDMLLEPDPECIATNCPFCMTMIDDGVKGAGVDENVKVYDVGELLWRSLKKDAPAETPQEQAE